MEYTNLPAEELLGRLREEGQPEQASKLRRAFWENHKKELLGLHRAGAGGQETACAICRGVDAIVLDLHERAAGQHAPRGYALVALGGYGRQEMSPYSDVDLLFLFGRERDKSADFIGGVLHALWDMGFEVGHSSRTPAESTKLARADLKSCTAMMDARFLAGQREIFDEFVVRLFKQLPKTVVNRLHKLQRERSSGSGSVQLLEPSVKESPGGLREIHLLEWALKGMSRDPALDIDGIWGQYLDREDRDSLVTGRDFLWRVRHELHLTMGREHDVLEQEIKPVIARNLGYTDRSVISEMAAEIARGASGAAAADADAKRPEGPDRVGTADRLGDDRGREFAAEHFMQDYYLHARHICHLVDLGFRRLTLKPSRRRRPLLLEEGVIVVDGEIELLEGQRYFEKDPRRLLSIFALSRGKRLPLSEKVQRIIRQSIPLIDAAVREDTGAREIFMQLLRRKQRVAGALRNMHELGVLGAYLPEFEGLTCLVQYDIYHLYTADEHTLVALERLEELARVHERNPLRLVYEELDRRDLLLLGALLHDVGKSRRQEHVRSGIEMATVLLARLGLPEADRRFVLFLVEHHQEMVIISQRRDLDDYSMIADFAALFASAEWLKALYLLSYADLSAVAEDAWSDWHGALLWELYHKTMEQLESGFKTVEDRQQARELMSAHLDQVSDFWPPLKVVAFEEHVKRLPPRYLVAYEIGEIERHLGLISRFEDGCEVEFVQHQAHTEIVICTCDQRQLLAKICGVLAVHDIDILRADVQTRDDDIVIDVFQVTDVSGSPMLPEAKRERVCERLKAVIGGTIQVSKLFENYSTRWSQRRKDAPHRAPEIGVENQVSDRYTVIDVDVSNVSGLLYKITHTLGEMDLDIHMAIVNTVADRARDAFYVVGRQGEKIVNYEIQEEIKSRLRDGLAS